MVLKLSNGVMFRIPLEVQGMQLQAVVDTAAQVTLVSEEFYKSLDPVPPIAGKWLRIQQERECR
jgi:hypothetical protein